MSRPPLPHPHEPVFPPLPDLESGPEEIGTRTDSPFTTPPLECKECGKTTPHTYCHGADLIAFLGFAGACLVAVVVLAVVLGVQAGG